MLSFLRQQVTRTNTASHNPILFDDGRSSIRFHSPTSPWMMSQTLSPSSMFCTLAPPTHYHLHQTESYRITHGTAAFEVSGVKTVVSHDSADPTFTVPAGKSHKFWNASEEESLEVDMRLDPPDYEREESFFRNLYGYRQDCLRKGVQPSPLQLMRFLYAGRAPVSLPLPGPEWVARSLSRLLMFVLGVVMGDWVFGYKGSYREYYKASAE